MGTDLLIQTTGLTKHFGKVAVVNDVNMEVWQGQIYGFLGPNGAGKTTTIRLLLGLMRPSTGTIRIFGKSIEKERISILSRIGSLVESPSYYRNLTGYENLEAARRLLGAERSEIDRVLRIVRLTDARNELARGYSLGMRQRLGIALALLGNPQLLILDEPTNGLDPSGIHEIRELIASMPQQYGITVLISSHNLAEIELLATHVGIIQQGQFVFQGTIDQLRQRSQSVLHTRSNRVEQAAQHLHSLGYPVQLAGEYIHLQGYEYRESELNERLVLAGFEVSHLARQNRTLEEIFLELTDRRGL